MIKQTKTSIFYTFLLLITFFSCKKPDHPPVITNQESSIDENLPSGSFVYQVVAFDEDAGQTLSYSITGGNTNNAFKISETDGSIFVDNDLALDFETIQSFTLAVLVKDNRRKSSSANVVINLTNVVPSTSGLILYMPFNGNVNDLSGSNNNGIDYTSHNYVAGKWSQAMDFNGKTDYVQLANSINSQNGLSFSFWMKLRAANGNENNGAIVSKYSKIYDIRCFMIWSMGTYYSAADYRLSAAFYKYGYSATIHDHVKSYMEAGELTIFPNPALWTITNPKRLVAGTWTHCIVNVTPTTIETWLDGVLCVKKTREYSSYYNSASEQVQIGNCYDIGEGSNNHFNGVLDELRIYNRVLTTDEIKILFME